MDTDFYSRTEKCLSEISSLAVKISKANAASGVDHAQSQLIELLAKTCSSLLCQVLTNERRIQVLEDLLHDKSPASGDPTLFVSDRVDSSSVQR